MNELVLSPTDFVAVLNQSLEYAYPNVTIEGELANFKVSRNRWVYFDIKDENSSLKCFGTVYTLPGPLEDGMMIRITAQPRLHPLYNFSLNLQSIIPVGEGSLKKAADLLQAKLQKEGLFDEERKRPVPYPPKHIGLITSKQAAAYSDFIKILDARWGGIQISHIDVQVQGEQAVFDVVKAIEKLNQIASVPEVIVITRGGGSAEDLAAFSTEQVTRAVATSRIPTLVAVGHEVDISLAELAADQRASTPSNAAELLVPDKRTEKEALVLRQKQLREALKAQFNEAQAEIKERRRFLVESVKQLVVMTTANFDRQRSLLKALSPENALKRGYAVIRANGKVVRSVKSLHLGQSVNLLLSDGSAEATINKVK